MTRTSIAVASLAAIVLATSGCGSSSSGSSDTALSRGELIAKADAICSHLKVQRKALLGQATRAQFASRLGQAGNYAQTAATELSRLKPPTTLAADWKQIVENEKQLAADTVTLSGYLTTHNPRGARLTLASAGTLEQTTSGIAIRDGFGSCSHFS
jgi:hypothetical protein